MKKLPKIYKQEINKKITNNTTVYYSTAKDIKTEDKKEEKIVNVRDFLQDLFHQSGYVFNKDLIIVTEDKTYNTSIIKRSEDYIYTIDEDRIKIDDIKSIKRK